MTFLIGKVGYSGEVFFSLPLLKEVKKINTLHNPYSLLLCLA